MNTRVDAVDDGGRLRPLQQLELEEQARLRLTLTGLDEEFQREFGREKPVVPEAGPEPWSGFLDLSLL